MAAAYDETAARPPALKGNAWKVWLVAGDCFLIGLAPVLVHMAKDSRGKFAFNPVAVNLLVEAAKVVFAIGTLLYHVRARERGREGPPPLRGAAAALPLLCCC